MFGYVRAYKPNLTFSQYDIYKGVYCSLCKTIGKRYGFLARMTLSYDLSFFAMMRMAVSNQCVEFKNSSCSFNPLKKCLKCHSIELDYSADVLMLMVYYKYLDNLNDYTALKKTILKLSGFYFKRLWKKAKKRCPQADEILKTMHTEQIEIESKQLYNIDEACHPSAKALGDLLVLNMQSSSEQTLKRFGYAIGRWVYLIDAADDYIKDKKTNSFNPLLKYTDDNYKEYAKGALNLTVSEAINCFNELEITKFKPILTNILYDGLYSSMNCVLDKE